MPAIPDHITLKLTEVSNNLGQVMAKDRYGLDKRIHDLLLAHQQAGNKPVSQQRVEKLLQDYQRSCERYQRRKHRLPEPALNADLPVIQFRDEITRAIQANQVVVIAGETGSGKTTQLPQICLSLGRGVSGLIGHTQPRRIAARSVAQRIADELKSELGDYVGYKVRFTGQVRQESFIKIMTDGILLAELQTDHFLSQYDTLIIDEAHERNLNIDFILGYLKSLLPKRPDLKVIITSATIDTGRFATHFGGAPVIEVSGRTYPVEVRYRPVEETEELIDQGNKVSNAILAAIRELDRHGRGDILVFLCGERDIRDTHHFLKQQLDHNSNEILPLFARLSAQDQNRVFQASKKRRIILSTNVAETSLTVPGIKYVIDTGKARINRYNYKTKVQRLPIEKISQANADQRKGRCGRVSDGVCIRLYSQEDFESRPVFADPEITRVNLASVILRMKVLKLGHIEEFPFLDPPDHRYIKDGYKLLNELLAIDHYHKLTPIGRQLARMPIDPKIARMLIEASKRNTLQEALVIASALSVQDPRERPHEFTEAADKQHGIFQDESSDFLFYVNLWNAFHEHAKHSSVNQLRKWCREHFLSYQRMREWLDVHTQLLEIAGETGGKLNQQPASYQELHCALCAGLLGNIGCHKEKQEYSGARDIGLALFPGSVLAKKPPKWIVAAELIETQKLYAHTAAKIQPEWLEELASHITKHHYTEPHWDEKTGHVSAYAKITLYGLTIAAQKKINYEKISVIESRELFIRAALVEQKLQSKAHFYRHNSGLIAQIRAEEEKLRVRGLLASDEELYALYDKKIPAHICNVKTFKQWIEKQEAENPDYLCFTRQQFTSEMAGKIAQPSRPDRMELDNISFELEYAFDIGAQHDGVSVLIPHVLINQAPEYVFDWLVPGFLQEKIGAIIKSLPKKYRRSFVPAPEYAKACAAAMQAYQSPLLPALAAQLKLITGVEVPQDVWSQVTLPDYLRMNFKILDDHGKVVQTGRDLAKLKIALKTGQTVNTAQNLLEASGVTQWEFGDLPVQKTIEVRGFRLGVFPALVDEGESVALKNFENQAEAIRKHRNGVARLYQIQEKSKIKYVEKNIPLIREICLNLGGGVNCDELKRDLMQCVITRSLFHDVVDIRNKTQFLQRCAAANSRINGECVALSNSLVEISRYYNDIKHAFNKKTGLQWLAAVQDMRSQLEQLIYPGFIQQTEPQWFKQLAKYLKGMLVRINKLEQSPEKDRQRLVQLSPYWGQYQEWIHNPRIVKLHAKELSQYHWMLQEMRISLFCQELGAAMKISLPRLNEAVSEIKDSLKQNKTLG
ncbi:MAG TPA: ATP-dependent RNA helicase HrpA [Gammaproteobacteria bacterium]